MNYTRSQKKRYDSILEENTAKFLSNIKQELATTSIATLTNESEQSSKHDGDDDESHKSSSTLEKCPICLQKFSFKSKSYASKCFHSYCFECLLEWTKIRYSCPLCKQAFDRIIYDVKSNLEYKEHFLKPKTDESLNYPLEIIAYLPPPGFTNNFNPEFYNNNNNNNNNNNAHSSANVEPVRSKASWTLNRESAPVEFRMLVYKNCWYVNPSQIQIEIKVTNVELEFNDSENTNLNAQLPIRTNECETTATSLTSTLYKHVNKFRQASPQWFRNNPATCHRLHSFLFREMHALSSLRKIEISITKSQLIQKIYDLTKEVFTDSDEFIDEIMPFIRPVKYARHFSHELTAYIKSASHDLFDYDAKCVYYKDKRDLPETCIPNNNDIFPFKSLPINLSKYRLEYKEDKYMRNSNRNVNMFIGDDDDDDEVEDQEVVSLMNPQSLVVLNGNSDEENSSFCEEVTPPRKPTPVCIVLSASSSCSSSSSEASDSQMTSKKSTTSHKEKVQKREHSRSSENSRHKHRRHRSKKSSKKKSRDKSPRSRSHKKSKKRRKKEVISKDNISTDEETG